MANIIGTKKYLQALVINKNTGRLEKMVVKSNLSNYKLSDKFSNHIEESIRRTKQFDGK